MVRTMSEEKIKLISSHTTSDIANYVISPYYMKKKLWKFGLQPLDGPLRVNLVYRANRVQDVIKHIISHLLDFELCDILFGFDPDQCESWVEIVPRFSEAAMAFVKGEI